MPVVYQELCVVRRSEWDIWNPTNVTLPAWPPQVLQEAHLERFVSCAPPASCQLSDARTSGGDQCDKSWPPTFSPAAFISLTPSSTSLTEPLAVNKPVCLPSGTALPTILDVGQGGSRYHLPVTINGLLVNAVVDTGADVTVVAAHIAAQLTELSWKRQAQLQNFTGGSTTAYGPEAVRLAADTNVIRLEVYSAPLLEECILGNDALTALGAVIDCRTRQVTLRPISQEPISPPVKRIRTSSENDSAHRADYAPAQSRGRSHSLARRRRGWWNSTN